MQRIMRTVATRKKMRLLLWPTEMLLLVGALPMVVQKLQMLLMLAPMALMRRTVMR
jgi:hypothetical protein